MKSQFKFICPQCLHPMSHDVYMQISNSKAYRKTNDDKISYFIQHSKCSMKPGIAQKDVRVIETLKTLSIVRIVWKV